MIRTTSGGDGFPHGIAVGEGDDPAGALHDLVAVAGEMVTDLIRRAHLRQADMFDPDDWGIEVIDVRLVPGPDASAHHAWTAYGTLRTTGLSPLALQEDR